MIVTRKLNQAIVSVLMRLVNSVKYPQVTKQRAEICLNAFEFANFLPLCAVAEITEVSAKTVRKIVKRFEQSLEALEACVAEGGQAKLERAIVDCLQDAPRKGRPPVFSPQQVISIISIACEKPEDSGRPISKWTSREIADEGVKRNIVPSISRSHVAKILRSVHLQPHKTKGWCFTTEKDQEEFTRKTQVVCDVYQQAPQSYEQSGVHTVSVDEATGLQANEKRAPSLPPQPDQRGKEETQYTRHGAVCLTVAWHVVLGQVISHSIQTTRNNVDFANFIKNMIQRDPDGQWVIVLDNLNTHSSERLVRLVARLEGISPRTLGNKKKRKGILGSIKSRQQFLSDPQRRIRFVYTPKHSSWLNQVEVILGIIRRRALASASFTSQNALIERLNAFIDYFNATFAKPMKWTYTGRPTESEEMHKPLTWRQRATTKTWKQYWKERPTTLAG